MDDEVLELIERARQGEAGAFERLAEEHRGRIEALVRSRLGSRLLGQIGPEDVVQETLMRALKSLKSYAHEGADSFFRWLAGIAHHVILEAARRHDRELIVPLDADIPGAESSPSSAARRDERFERLQAALDSLSPDHRRVILLARVERLPLKEVARRMERSPEAATQLLWRALKKLKESFGSTDSFHLPPRALQDRGGSP